MVWPTLGSRTAKEQEQSIVVQVIKSLQDPLEVGNNLPSLSWSSSPSFHVFRHPDRDDDCPRDLVLWNRGRSIDSTCSRAQVSLRRLLKPTLIGLHTLIFIDGCKSRSSRPGLFHHASLLHSRGVRISKHAGPSPIRHSIDSPPFSSLLLPVLPQDINHAGHTDRHTDA